jgi:hypothetical protein
MAKIFKAAVVGMGGIGHTHANCIINDPLAELVAVCENLFRHGLHYRRIGDVKPFEHARLVELNLDRH